MGPTSVLRDGNLRYSSTADQWNIVTSTMAMSSGKWYCEITTSTTSLPDTAWGIRAASITTTLNTYPYLNNEFVLFVNQGYYTDGAYTTDGTPIGSFAPGDVCGMALDMDAGTLTYYQNGRLLGTAFTNIAGKGPMYWCSAADKFEVDDTWNFGASKFKYPAPAGFLALCDTNLT